MAEEYTPENRKTSGRKQKVQPLPGFEVKRLFFFQIFCDVIGNHAFHHAPY